MIICFEGTPGSGKSYEAVKKIIDNLMLGRTVYTNIDGLDDPLCREHIKSFSGLSDYELETRLIHLPNWQALEFYKHVSDKSLVVLDEVHKLYNNRNWQKDINTHFADSSGLDPGSFSTAKDLVTLIEYLLNKYPLIWQVIGLKEYDLYLDNGEFHHKLINTNELLGAIPEVVGGKTGFTDYAKGCFLVVEESPKEGNYLIHVILGSGDKLEEMKKIINWLNVAYKW